jgi:hypothetical protein
VQLDPAWYFGDLVALLQEAGQDIQSHTFSHMYVGFAAPEEVRADLEAWRQVARERGVAPAVALAFPWSGSAGMADATWAVLEQAGVRVVTRTKGGQRQYQLASLDDLHCKPVRGHEQILACPDLYLTPRSEPQALEMIDRAIAQRGMIDLWAHTEEVTSPEQIAAWSRVVAYAAEQQRAGRLWIAPLAEIAERQRDAEQVELDVLERPAPGADDAPFTFRLHSRAQHELTQLAVELPFAASQVTVVGEGQAVVRGTQVLLDLRAGATLEVQAWPA